MPRARSTGTRRERLAAGLTPARAACRPIRALLALGLEHALAARVLAVKATRIYEGIEDDHYACEKGHHFGMDYRRGPATEPQWPPPQELVDAFKKR